MLLELIKKNVDILENKETNAVVSSKKRTAWNEIAQRFNRMAVTGPRNWMQLRNLYENLKQRKKRKNHKEKQLSCTDDDALNTGALTENDKWIQTIVSPKAEPIHFDIELTVSGDDMETITVPAQPFILKHEIEEGSIYAAGNSSSTEDLDDISKKKPPENETCCSSAKEEYYKLKLSNAKLERKFLLQRHKMEKEKLTLELEILNLKRQKIL